MSEERSEINDVNDRAGDDEVPDNEKELDSTLECPAAPRLATIELPPDEDDNMISGPSEEGEGLPEALLFSDYGYIGSRK